MTVDIQTKAITPKATAGWSRKRLDELGFVGRGKSRHRPRNAPSLYGGSYPFIQTGEIKAANLYVTEYSQTYNERGLAQSRLWEAGTLLITIAANIAETAILKIRACFPDSVVGFVADPQKSDVRYVKYCLETVKLHMQSVSKGTTQDNLPLESLLSFELLVPALSVQRKIAAILSTYDNLIENNTRRIRTLEEMAQTIYREWFVNYRFPGHENVPMVDSKLGKTPQGWEIAGLTNSDRWDFISSNIREYEGSKEYFATADIEGVEIVNRGKLVSFGERPSRAQKEPVLYSVWFARMRDTHKVLGFTTANEDIAENSVLSSGFAGFRSNRETFPFLYYTINSVWFHEMKNQFCTGATQMSLTNEGLSRIECITPPSELISEYGAIVLPLLDLVFILQEQKKTLGQIRDILLPRLISGELDVSDLEVDVREEAS